MNSTEKFQEILETLEQVAELKKQPILESELRTIAKSLVEHHGIELFRILRAIPGEKYFPSGHEIEQGVRKVLGKPPLKGLDEERIAQFEREAVVGGQSPEVARRGADLMRGVLASQRPKAAPISLAALEDFGEEKVSSALDALEAF